MIERDPLTGMQIRIGVMGSAAGALPATTTDVCDRLGRAIADHGCCLLTGACPGFPHDVVCGAKQAGGHVVGISPGASLREHVEVYESPYAEYDVLIFTGLGAMGRSGTLGEFAIAYEEGKLIGVLTETGGITAAIPTLEDSLDKRTGSEVLYEADPETLIDQLLARYLSGNYTCPCYPVGGGNKK